MAGLNFQTMTIINSNVDPDSDNKALFEADDTNNVLNIKRDFHFHKDDTKGKICAIRKTEAVDAVKCVATIDFAKLSSLIPTSGKNYARLDINLGYEGAAPFIAAIQSPNDVRNHIPFWIEFVVKSTDEADDIANNVEKLIKANNVFQCDKDLIKVANDGAGKLTLTGSTEYQRFDSVVISMFSATDDYAEEVAVLSTDSDDAIVSTVRGTNSFGTYSQITKDLVLPTVENWQHNHIRQAETPIVGAKYNQFIIEYQGPSVNDGLQFVGQRGTTHTLHVFWVNQDVSSDFEDAIKTAFGGDFGAEDDFGTSEWAA